VRRFELLSRVILTVLLVLSWPVQAQSQAQSQADTDPIKLVILHVNDWDRLDPTEGAGGAAKIASTIRRERALAIAEGGVPVVTFGGDMISPSLLSAFDRGAHMIALANRIGFDMAVLGNHEFDFGPRILAARLKESSFPWLASNIDANKESGFPGTKQTLVRKIGGYTIGFIGLLTPETVNLSSPGQTVSFRDPIETARELAAKLKDEGADIVLALTHQDAAADHALLEAVPEVDGVLGGHDHLQLAYFDGRQLILKAGTQGAAVGKLTLDIRRVESRGTLRLEWRPELALLSSAGVAPDPAVAKEVDDFVAKLDAEMGQTIGKTTVELDTRRATVRSQEAAFGNLVADAMRAAVDADVALTNGGGIRGDTTYLAGTDLTRKDVLTELPFGNKTVKLRLTGAQLREALETGVSGYQDTAGRFPQVSGLSFRFDPARDAGSRVVEVKVGGKPLDPEARYTLATNDFLARGGDGYAVFRDLPRLIDAASGQLMAAQVIAKVEKDGGVTVRVTDRIRKVE